MSPVLLDRNTSLDGNTWATPVASAGHDTGSRVELGRTLVLPGNLLGRYITVAMRRALPRQLEGSDRWFADLPGFPGALADGESPKECLDTLAEVLQDWLILKLADQDLGLPVVDEIDLTVVCQR